MNDYTNPPPPRRSLVPGPSGIAAKAVALRERVAQAKPGEGVRVSAEEFAEIRAMDKAQRDKTLHDAYPAYIVPGPIGKIAGAIAGVMSEIGTIPKTGYNKFHNYHYATLPDLLFVLTPLMGKHGVVVFQSELETKTIENRIAVTYEFTVAHSSGETWPERLKFTGMAMGRDSKGSWDDKAINKCHSAARKYFLLALFQVPTGDFEDADEGPVEAKAKRTVPGPDLQKVGDKAVEILKEKAGPRKITLGPGAGADAWAKAFIDGIKTAQNGEELSQWDELNSTVLNKLSNEYSEMYLQIDKAVVQKTLQIAPLRAMPDPERNMQEAMNWVAQMLSDCAAYPEAERLWNEAIAPHEERFDPEDWELLMNEWRRAEIRLNPEPEEPEPPEAA